MSDPVTFRLDDRVAVVTGALGLIGREHCRALAKAGAHVAVVDLDAEACVAFANDLSTTFERPALGMAANILDRTALEGLRDRLFDRWGRLDVLVNNAAINDKVEARPGSTDQTRFENYPIEAFRQVLDVNVTGTFLCCQVLGTAMATQRQGSIINVASTYGMVAPNQALYVRPDGTQPFFKTPAYPTSKGAVIALTKFLASYWGHTGVRVNTLSPGGVQTPQTDAWFVENYATRTPLRRMAHADDYQGALLFLASDASAYMTGANLVVDGGWTCW